MERLVLTNNPKIFSIWPAARWIEGSPLDVLLECRKKVHEGYPLHACPLGGDIHLVRNPFRTVVLGQKRREADPVSVRWAEESVERVRSIHSRCREAMDPEDYQILDADLFRAVMD